MRPPSKGWYTHDEQIRAELDNLRKALNEARSRECQMLLIISIPIIIKYQNCNLQNRQMQRCRNMSIKVKKPEVKMNLYETDKDVLKSFITNEKIRWGIYGKILNPTKFCG